MARKKEAKSIRKGQNAGKAKTRKRYKSKNDSSF